MFPKCYRKACVTTWMLLGMGNLKSEPLPWSQLRKVIQISTLFKHTSFLLKFPFPISQYPFPVFAISLPLVQTRYATKAVKKQQVLECEHKIILKRIHYDHHFSITFTKCRHFGFSCVIKSLLASNVRVNLRLLHVSHYIFFVTPNAFRADSSNSLQLIINFARLRNSFLPSSKLSRFLRGISAEGLP